jgi:arylformamidase
VSFTAWNATKAEERFASFDRPTLEREYSPSSAVGGDITEYLRAYETQSEQVRASFEDRAALNVSYGPEPSMTFDVFPTAGTTVRPALIFFHGGYWQALSSKDTSFPALVCSDNGITYISVNYPLAPSASLSDIVKYACIAVRLIVERAKEFGIDPTRVAIGGHSAGAHLAMCCAAQRLTKRVLLVAGVFELLPLLQTTINDALALGPGDVDALSPLRHVPDILRAAIVWGDADTREFAWQSKAMSTQLEQWGAAVESWEQEQRNHFDLLLDLADPATRLAKAIPALFR